MASENGKESTFSDYALNRHGSRNLGEKGVPYFARRGIQGGMSVIDSQSGLPGRIISNIQSHSTLAGSYAKIKDGTLESISTSHVDTGDTVDLNSNAAIANLKYKPNSKDNLSSQSGDSHRGYSRFPKDNYLASGNNSSYPTKRSTDLPFNHSQSLQVADTTSISIIQTENAKNTSRKIDSTIKTSKNESFSPKIYGANRRPAFKKSTQSFSDNDTVELGQPKQPGLTENKNNPIFPENTQVENEKSVVSRDDDKAKKVTYSVPFGESGKALMRSGTTGDSMIRLFQFESIHAAAHRNHATSNGIRIEQQNIRIRSGISPEGKLVAVAGATETIIGDSPQTKQAIGSDSAVSTEDASTTQQVLSESGEELIRELAFISDMRQMFVSGGAFLFGMSKRPMPRIVTSGSVSAGLKAMNDLNELTQLTDRQDIFSLVRSLSESEIDKLLSEFKPIEKALSELQSAINNLLKDGGALTGLNASGGDPVVAASVTSTDAVPGEYSIHVDRMAEAHSIRSTFYAPGELRIEKYHNDERGYFLDKESYTFSINGVDITVNRGDSMSSIARKINQGEDIDGNGELRTGEPLREPVTEVNVRWATTRNIAGTYDSGSKTLTSSTDGDLRFDGYTVTAGDRVLLTGQNDPTQNGIYTISDTGGPNTPWTLTRDELFDEDGELSRNLLIEVTGDSSFGGAKFIKQNMTDVTVDTTAIHYKRYYNEDTNGNGYLDGGTSAHGVTASVKDGFLTLTMAETGPKTIDLYDPDGFLEAIGMLSRNGSDIDYGYEVQAASSSLVIADGKNFRSSSNTVENAIAGLKLELQQTGEETVDVSVSGDAEKMEKELEKLVAGYNKTMRALNKALSSTGAGLLKSQEHINRVYINLRDAAGDPVGGGLPDNMDTAAEAGLIQDKGQRLTFHAQQLDYALRSIKSGGHSPLKNATSPASVYNALDEIGITSEEDNTLRVNRDILRSAIDENPEAVRDLFRGEGGLLERISNATENAADPNNGLVAFNRRTLSILAGKDLAMRIGESAIRSQQSMLRANLTNTLLAAV